MRIPMGARVQERLILKSIADGVLATDPDGAVAFANDAIATLLGYVASDLTGVALSELLAETELLGMLGLREAVQPGEAAWMQVVFKNRAQDYVPLSVTLSELQVTSGESPGYVLVCRPQDEVRELLSQSSRLVAEEIERRVEMQRAKDAAEHREQLQMEVGHAQKLESIGQLAAGIAHEINTPIQFIGDNVVFLKRAFGMLSPVVDAAKQVMQSEGAAPDLSGLKRALRKAKSDYLQAEIPKAIEQTEEGIKRVATIVRAMKEVSHPASGEVQIVDLHRMITSTVTVARNEWKYVAEIETDFDPDMPALACFPDEISQVVLNIVVNAAHAIGDVTDGTSELGKIGIKTLKDESHAEIQITDTGTGIPREIVDRIFDPFFTTKEVGKGTGQGLALAYHVVTKRHGGTISVSSAEGQGTTFRIRIPLEPRERSSTQPTSLPAARGERRASGGAQEGTETP